MRPPEQEPAQPVDGIAVDSAYWQFYDQVAAAQVADWLPTEPALIVDLSGGCGRFTEQLLEPATPCCRPRTDHRHGRRPGLAGVRW